MDNHLANHWYLLWVDKDHTLQANNQKILEQQGYKIRQAFTLAEARSIIVREQPHVIILDILLPDGNGLDFLCEVRKTSNVPVLILTAMNTPADVIKGLKAGGDTYLPKPYELPVFLTHLEALLRRASIVPDTIVFGPYRLEPMSCTAYLNGENMFLAQKEFALLQQFLQHPDKTMNAEYLYKKAWGRPMAGDPRALGNAVSRLRQKMKGCGYTISAEYGNGYRFEHGDP
ncbi:MAG: response regulator transcription factor [Peptococcaceae bacterium]|nr:response regulator transcription factor [Peptococcaceae bacterium]